MKVICIRAFSGLAEDWKKQVIVMGIKPPEIGDICTPVSESSIDKNFFILAEYDPYWHWPKSYFTAPFDPAEVEVAEKDMVEFVK